MLRKRMMVGKGMLDHVQATDGQIAKETFRITDSRDGVHRTAPEIIQGARIRTAIQSRSLSGHQCHEHGPGFYRYSYAPQRRMFRKSVDNDQIGPRHAG